MKALDTIKSTKFEAGIQYLSVLFFSRKTRFALVIKINKISYLSNSLQPTLNLKCTRSSHWSINKLITANDRIGDTCCRFETITGHQFSFQHIFNNCTIIKLEQQSTVHHRKYPLFTCNIHLGVKVTQNVAQYLLHNVTYASVKFKVAMSNG